MEVAVSVTQRRLNMYMYMLHTFKNISHELIGYNTKIGTDRVEWGRLNIWIVLRISFKVV